MNRDLIIGLGLLYIANGIIYSEIRRILIGIALDNKPKVLFELLNKKRYKVLNFIFNPVLSTRLKFDEWRYNL